MIGRFTQLGVYSELADSRDMYRIAAGGFLALVGYLWQAYGPVHSFVGNMFIVGSLALNGLPIIRAAAGGLMRRQVNVDELVSLAIIASVIQGEFLSAAIVAFVMNLGSIIEQVTSGSARRAIRSLMSISPQTATKIVDGEPQTVSISRVRIGDQLMVKPGERIPVDAVICEGRTTIDTSSMTGEPIPREAAVGDTVYAGTLNQTGLIRIETASVGEDTTLGKVIKLVTAAEEYKPRSVRLIDRYAAWFTPTILACAGLAWIITGDLSRAVTVLIVGCPCALILAAPTAVVASIGRAARSGILVKGGQFVEEVGRAGVVLFDKTGTLTKGEPNVAEIVAIGGKDEKDVLACAASVEQDSTHPLARAVLKAAHYARVTLAKAEEMVAEIGLGVRACVSGKVVEVGSAYLGGGVLGLPASLRDHVERFKEIGATPLIVYEDQSPVGALAVSDPVRPSAKETVAMLKSIGIRRVGMVSGDHKKSVRLVADEVGLTDAWSEQKPQDKLKVIREFQESGAKVVFVGDGINDAPALAAANVGIAMGAAGTDVALETADVALMNDDISKIPFFISLSRRTIRTIKWNVAFGILFNTVAVAAGGWGLLSPVIGAIVHNVGSIIVVISSAHLAFVSSERAN